METCQSCGLEKEDVQERECGYSADINGTVVLEVVCDDCEEQHCLDI